MAYVTRLDPAPPVPAAVQAAVDKELGFTPPPPPAAAAPGKPPVGSVASALVAAASRSEPPAEAGGEEGVGGQAAGLGALMALANSLPNGPGRATAAPRLVDPTGKTGEVPVSGGMLVALAATAGGASADPAETVRVGESGVLVNLAAVGAAHGALAALRGPVREATAHQKEEFRRAINAERRAGAAARLLADGRRVDPEAAGAASKRSRSPAAAAARPAIDGPVQYGARAEGRPVIQEHRRAPKDDPADAAAVAAAKAEVSGERDYLGRGFLHTTAPAVGSAAARRLAAEGAGAGPPTRLRHVFKGHKAGVQAMRWLPRTAHLLLSADLSGTALLWDVGLTEGRQRRLVATYHHGGTAAGASGHALNSIAFNHDGTRFASAGADGAVVEWDTESGKAISARQCGAPSDGRGAATVEFDPRYRSDLDASAAMGAAVASPQSLYAAVGRVAVQWDLRAPRGRSREYDAHQAPILHLGFLRCGTHFVTSSEDKSLRAWDVDSAVAVQDVADPTMHAVPHFAERPGDGTLVCNSLDNKALVLRAAGPRAPGRFRFLKDRCFEGHVISGSACQVGFSADGRFVSSGDVQGGLRIWDFAARKDVKALARAHSKPLVAHLWHPSDPSRLVTSGWDGMVKMFA